MLWMSHRSDGEGDRSGRAVSYRREVKSVNSVRITWVRCG